MKVLHISKNWFNTKVYKYLYDHLSIYLQQKVVAIVPNDSIIISSDDNVDVYKCLYTRLYGLYSLKIFIIYSILKRNFNKYQPVNLMHAHFVFFDGDVAFRLFKKYNIPYLVTVRGSDIYIFQKRIYLKNIGRKILQNASRIVFISKSHYDFLINYFSSDKLLSSDLRNKSVIIPNGIEDFWHENRFFWKDKKLGSVIKILTVAGIDSNKNHLMVAESLKILQKTGYIFEYRIIGKILDNNIYEKLLKYDFVKYQPSLPQDKLIDFYRSSDIFIMPSFYETFGLVFIESISQGLPVIYSKNQGIDGFFNSSVGFGIDPRNQQELIATIILVIKNYDKFSFQNLDLSDFKWSEVGKKFYNTYNKII